MALAPLPSRVSPTASAGVQLKKTEGPSAGPRPAASSDPLGLGNLFAGGVPKLKKSPGPQNFVGNDKAKIADKDKDLGGLFSGMNAMPKLRKSAGPRSSQVAAAPDADQRNVFAGGVPMLRKTSQRAVRAKEVDSTGASGAQQINFTGNLRKTNVGRYDTRLVCKGGWVVVGRRREPARPVWRGTLRASAVSRTLTGPCLCWWVGG